MRSFTIALYNKCRYHFTNFEGPERCLLSLNAYQCRNYMEGSCAPGFWWPFLILQCWWGPLFRPFLPFITHVKTIFTIWKRPFLRCSSLTQRREHGPHDLSPINPALILCRWLLLTITGDCNSLICIVSWLTFSWIVGQKKVLFYSDYGLLSHICTTTY